MASNGIKNEQRAAMDRMSKFVDDLYFPLTGLPPMSVFHGAWGYIGDGSDSGDRKVDEFALATQQLANCNNDAFWIW